MDIRTIYISYYQAVYETDQVKATAVLEDALREGVSAETLVFEVVIPGINAMLDAFLTKNDVSLARHFLASRIAGEVVDFLVPHFSGRSAASGTVILGNAEGDFHGLGKKIVGGCLKAHLYKVVDLGVNVSAEKFVDAALSEDARIIGVSSMMLHTAIGESGPMGVRRILEERGLSDRIKLIVGGAPYLFDDGLAGKVGADGWARDGLTSVELVARLTGDGS